METMNTQARIEAKVQELIRDQIIKEATALGNYITESLDCGTYGKDEDYENFTAPCYVREDLEAFVYEAIENGHITCYDSDEVSNIPLPELRDIVENELYIDTHRECCNSDPMIYIVGSLLANHLGLLDAKIIYFCGTNFWFRASGNFLENDPQLYKIATDLVLAEQQLERL